LLTAPPTPPPERRVFANRTLNLRAIKAVGCDMDYTLIHYRHELWEQRAYDHVVRRMGESGWPVQGLRFDPEFATRGLVIDLELGNLVKATRFGFVLRACHGTRVLDHDEQRKVYSRVLVDLSEPRWVFLNTLFSLSEACLYAQLVDRLDAGELKQPVGYRDLYDAVRTSVNTAHMEGALKADIVRDPDTFVEPDPELPQALLDLKHAGKTLLLITNSEWSYTQAMMSYAFDRHLPKGQTYRDLFDVLIVEARKPEFFTTRGAMYEVVGDDGLLKPAHKLERGHVYYGGNARLVEQYLQVPGEEILYIGDHVYADVHVTKDVLRWRTALVVREVEAEIIAAEAFTAKQADLSQLMAQKAELERQQSWLRLTLQRVEGGYAPLAAAGKQDVSEIKTRLGELRAELEKLDPRVGALAKEASELGHRGWGPLLRAGSDKSRMARQLERYADIYTSRVSNLLYVTPFAYLRPPPGKLPHDP
jgi:HAD superfamily 5'-nucleotidase-like hydrolase